MKGEHAMNTTKTLKIAETSENNLDCEKRAEYYKNAIAHKDYLPKSSSFCFSDGTYMASWYQLQKKKAQTILRKITEENTQIDEKSLEFLEWMTILHTDLKIVWVDNMLSFQRREQASDRYKSMKSFSEAAASNKSLLTNKKVCERVDDFQVLEEFYGEVEQRTELVATKNFPYANLQIENMRKCLVLKK